MIAVAPPLPDSERTAVGRLLAAGTPHRQIADELGLELDRVAWHARRIREAGPLVADVPGDASPRAATFRRPTLPELVELRNLLAETGPLTAGQIQANLELEPADAGRVLRAAQSCGLVRRRLGSYALTAAAVDPPLVLC